MKRRLSEAFYIGMLDILPLLRDPMILIMISLISFMPVIFIGLMASGTAIAVQSLIGAVVLTLFFGGIQVAQSSYFNKHWFRFQDIYVASPVRPVSYAMGLSISTIIGALPATLIAVAILVFIWPVSVLGIVMLVAVSLLLWASTVFLGFTLGSSLKDTRKANSIPQVLGFVLGFMPPVYYPLSVLPVWLQPIAMLSPTTHAAQLAKYYLGLIAIPEWQVIVGWTYLFGFLGLMVMLAKRWSKWVDP
ncbi:MAG: ABC transporter permease [Euryarchaeota archaeon]|nr:ABC transporter permease [Euryarchaeota archaeon]